MPVTQFAFKEKYRYQNGFNSYHECASFLSHSSTYTNSQIGVKR